MIAVLLLLDSFAARAARTPGKPLLFVLFSPGSGRRLFHGARHTKPRSSRHPSRPDSRPRPPQSNLSLSNGCGNGGRLPGTIHKSSSQTTRLSSCPD